MSNILNRSNATALSHDELSIESVVQLAGSITRGLAPEGRQATREMLGYGIVRDNLAHGASTLVCVYWPSADLDTWVACKDLEQTGSGARLLSLYRYDAEGHRKFERCKVISGAGLNYNWIVELFPENVIRTERSDSLAWTFDWNPLVERAYPHGTVMDDALAEDAHAEAITVAELSIIQ